MDYLSAIQSVMNPMCLLCILLGVAVGMVVGTLPGLTSVMAISLITPLTFKLNPTYGFAMLLGVYNSAIFSGGISAIAINTPGTPASIATTFDGYKISQRGQHHLLRDRWPVLHHCTDGCLCTTCQTGTELWFT